MLVLVFTGAASFVKYIAWVILNGLVHVIYRDCGRLEREYVGGLLFTSLF